MTTSDGDSCGQRLKIENSEGVSWAILIPCKIGYRVLIPLQHLRSQAIPGPFLSMQGTHMPRAPLLLQS